MSARQISLRHFAASRDAASVIEFALVLPVLILLMLAGLQLVLYVNATRKVEYVAASIGQMISEAAPPSNATTVASVNATDLGFSHDSTLVLFPYIMSDAAQKNIAWSQDISIDYASVQFKAIDGTSCSGYDQSACYSASVVWTSGSTTGADYRPCAPNQIAADDTAPPSPTTLPRSVFGPGSIIAVDVVFNFVPTFGAKFLPPIKIAKSVFLQPRYASLITYDGTKKDGIASPCP
jgi:Flp pilus assembly protein TadG